MKEIWRKYKAAVIAGGLVVCMTAVLGAGMKLTNTLAVSEIVKAADKEMDEPSDIVKIYYEVWDQNAPYKEYNQDQETAAKVCEKYGLDYDTVTLEEITPEMSSYAEALRLLKDLGNSPLLEESIKDGKTGPVQSLEMYICEIYAFYGGKDVIEAYCGEHGINPDKSVVSDLTAEELIEIGNLAFDTSDHGTEKEKDRINNRLYKEHQLDKKIAKQVCEKYNLNYDTAKVKDIKGEISAYEEALWLLKYLGASTLYEDNAERDGYKIVEWSLEAHIRDTNQLEDARNAIGEFCRKRGIDPDKAVISDFSAEDLTKIIVDAAAGGKH